MGDQLVARPLLTAPGDCYDGEVGGMNGFGGGNRSTLRKPTPTPLCPPQIPLAWYSDVSSYIHIMNISCQYYKDVMQQCKIKVFYKLCYRIMKVTVTSLEISCAEVV
jgi:hypothetical protein